MDVGTERFATPNDLWRAPWTLAKAYWAYANGNALIILDMHTDDTLDVQDQQTCTATSTGLSNVWQLCMPQESFANKKADVHPTNAGKAYNGMTP